MDMELRKRILDLLSRLESLLLTAYAEVEWNRLVRRAERLWRRSRTHNRVVVIRHPFNPKGLMYIDRGGFRRFKDSFRIDRRVSWGRLMDGAWYYTAGPTGDDALSGKRLEVRRLAFMRSLVKRL